MNERRTGTKIAATLAALAVGGLMVAPAAMAAPANIDPDAKGSLTIHKFETPDPWAEDENNSGLALDPTVTAGWEAVAGVTFKVEQVTALEGGATVDLTTPAGWDAIDTLTPAAAADGTLAAVTGSPKTTNASGVASFTDLPVGLYLVTETHRPANVASKVAPFLVTVPTPIIGETGAVNSWNYNVHAYPKNSVITVNKTVEELAQKALGEQIVWTVKGSVPVIGAAENHSKYIMEDTLPTQVTYDATKPSVKFDNRVTDPANYTITGTNPVVITLTPAGLTALKTGSVKEVTWELTTTVNALATDGILKNDVTLQANDSDKIPGEAQQNWGGIEITKTAKDAPEANKVLAGAEFQLFKTKADATAKTNPITVKQGSSVADVVTFVTGENGKVTIDGVQVGTYWLVETKAPAGYILNSTPIEVTVTAGGMTQLVKVAVDNEQKPPTSLPPTGAVGAVALSILGVGALATGVVLSRKSKAVQA